MTPSKMVRLLLTVTLSSLALATVGCAADSTDGEEGDEAQAETESDSKASAGAAVANYARNHDCEISGNHIVQLECPLSSDRAVYAYAKKKLGSKAYRCGAGSYICLSY